MLLLIIIALASCRSFDTATPTPESDLEPTSPSETSTPAPEYVTKLRNAEYQLGFVDALRVVQMTDGRFEGGTPGGEDFVSVIMTDFTVRGDLNDDGANEYVALVAENYGGSGVFVFLAVYSDVNGQPMYQTSVWVGDRPQVNELSIDADGIFMDATIHRADEPMCCPTLHTIRHYQLFHGQLDMIDYVTFTPADRLHTITIDSPVSGTEVFRSVRIRGSVAIAPFENNLVYRILDVGGVELAIGSINVSAPDLGAPGTFDETILLGNILSGAVIRIEVQDVNAQDDSLFAMDSVELVVK
jgi:hypothetical protein